MLADDDGWTVSPKEKDWVVHTDVLEDVLLGRQIEHDVVGVCNDNVDSRAFSLGQEMGPWRLLA